MRRALILLLLAGCGPIPLQQAERECYQDARLAQQPRGTIGIGIGSGGRRAVGGSVEISSDFLLGRDPSQVYDHCVMNKSGQIPSRPFSSLTAAPK